MITAIITALLLVLCSGAACAAILDTQRTERQATAAKTWRAATLRNGVTAEIPFSDIDSPINSPGLIEVHPHSRTLTSTAALSTAPVPAARAMEPLPTKGRKPVESTVESPKVSTAKETKFKWNYPQGGFSVNDPSSEALATLRRLIDDGERRKTVLSWAVFGSNGGSIYSNARPIIEEALSNAD